MKTNKLKAMLDDWAYWKENLSPHLGQNVSRASAGGEEPTGTQKRNDTHSDPVAAEVGRMEREEKVGLAVDDAVGELPDRLRRVIHAQHRYWRDESNGAVAARLGLKTASFNVILSNAYSHLHPKLLSLSREYRSAV